MMKIGIIGLGIIGSAWARLQYKAGSLVGTWNRTPKADALLPRTSPLELAEAADIVQIVIADPPAVRSVLENLAPALGAGKIVIQSSTIDPASSEEFKKFVESKGARYLEAPFTGSKLAAEAGKTVYYLGGDAALVEEVRPVLMQVAEKLFHIGSNIQATTLKLAMNLNLAAQMEGLSEALVLARNAGITDELFFDVMKLNVGYSGLTQLKEPKLCNDDYSAQFSIKHLLKDMRLASTVSAELPILLSLVDCLKKADAAGYSNDDICSLIRILPKS